MTGDKTQKIEYIQRGISHCENRIDLNQTTNIIVPPPYLCIRKQTGLNKGDLGPPQGNPTDYLRVETGLPFIAIRLHLAWLGLYKKLENLQDSHLADI